jgi:hypothetical protein
MHALLLFAQMISLAKYGSPLFSDNILATEDSCAVEFAQSEHEDGFFWLQHPHKQKGAPLSVTECGVLTLSYEAFKRASPSELSEIIRTFAFWQRAHQNPSAVISIDDMRQELGGIRNIIQLVEGRLNSGDAKHTLNGKDFYYDPTQTEMTAKLLAHLTDFSLSDEAQDNAYSVYCDESALALY